MDSTLHQVVNLYKPSGPTSFAMVQSVKKILNVKKAGHIGTSRCVDPARWARADSSTTAGPACWARAGESSNAAAVTLQLCRSSLRGHAI